MHPGNGWVSAEKGYRREAGNLLFHLVLLALLGAVALGGQFGYKADTLLVEGDSLANTANSLDEFHPGRLASAAGLAPFIGLGDAGFTSQGVIKVPDARPEQLGFAGVFLPTAAGAGGPLPCSAPAWRMR